MRRAAAFLAQEEGAIGAAEGQHLVRLGLLFQIAGHGAARQQADQELHLRQDGLGARRRVAAQHLEPRHLELHELAGAELHPFALGQLQGQAHHVAGDALDRIDEGVHLMGGASPHFAAVAEVEGAVGIGLGHAQQALPRLVLAAQQRGTGAGLGDRLALRQIADAARAAAGAALVEHRHLGGDGGIEDIAARGDTKGVGDAVGEVQGDLVLLFIHDWIHRNTRRAWCARRAATPA
ncbi:hypothetical protein D9M70_506420 [compost metagenome]